MLKNSKPLLRSPVVQSVADLTTDPGVVAQSHIFMEIDYEIISMVIFLIPLIEEGLMLVTSGSSQSA